MVVVVEYPITVQVDNVGAIFLSENTFLSQRKKHIYVHRHFIRNYFEDRTVKIQFVRSEENMIDPFKKNLSNGLFKSPTSRYVHRE